MTYIEMPKLSDTMTEGTVVKWSKAVGDSISVGDVLAEIETDKAVMELEAFDEGTLAEIYVNGGGKARIGEKLALLAGMGESAQEKKIDSASPGTQSALDVAKPVWAKSQTTPAKPAHDPVQTVADSSSRVKASPLAKKIAAAGGVDLSRVRGSGPGGRIVAKDLDSPPKEAVHLTA